jgi:hypothetical protein
LNFIIYILIKYYNFLTFTINLKLITFLSNITIINIRVKFINL